MSKIRINPNPSEDNLKPFSELTESERDNLRDEMNRTKVGKLSLWVYKDEDNQIEKALEGYHELNEAVIEQFNVGIPELSGKISTFFKYLIGGVLIFITLSIIVYDLATNEEFKAKLPEIINQAIHG
jgi:hypothetical protein